MSKVTTISPNSTDETAIDGCYETVGTESPAAVESGQAKGTNSAKAMFLSLLGRGGLLVLDSATGIVCARILRPDGRGDLSAMILWPVFLANACTLGVPSAVTYWLKRSRDQAGALIASATMLGGMMSLLTILIGVVVLPLWLHRYSPEMVRHAQWFMLAAPLSFAAVIFRSVWEATDEFGKSASAFILTRALTLVGLFGCIAFHNLTPFTAALCYVLSGVPAFLWTCGSILPRATWRVREMATASRTLFSYGIRSYGIDLCGALSQYVDQALVLGMLSPAEMGTYTVALSLSRVLSVISASMVSVLFPKTVGGTPERAIRLAVRTALASLLVSLIGVAFIFGFGAFLLNALYGREYLVVTGPLKILTIEAVVSGVLTVLSQPFMAMGKPGSVTVLQVAGLVTSIPMILVLAPRYGTVGASIALLCAAGVRAVLLAINYRRQFGDALEWNGIVPEESAVLISQLKARFSRYLPMRSV